MTRNEEELDWPCSPFRPKKITLAATWFVIGFAVGALVVYFAFAAG